MGYGNQTPVTDAGRVIAMVLMGVSIAFVSILTGAFAENLVVHRRDEDEHGEGASNPDGGDGARRAIAEIRERLDQLERSLPGGSGPPTSELTQETRTE